MGQRARAKKSRNRKRRASSVLMLIGVASLIAIVVAIGAVILTGDGEAKRGRSDAAPVVTDAMQVSVEVVDNAFEPANLVVQPGAEITWEFTGSLPHDVTDVEGGFESDTLRRGDTFAYTFDEPGTYYYYCTIHHVMQGSVRVAQPAAMQ